MNGDKQQSIFSHKCQRQLQELSTYLPEEGPLTTTQTFHLQDGEEAHSWQNSLARLQYVYLSY